MGDSGASRRLRSASTSRPNVFRPFRRINLVLPRPAGLLWAEVIPNGVNLQDIYLGGVGFGLSKADMYLSCPSLYPLEPCFS